MIANTKIDNEYSNDNLKHNDAIKNNSKYIQSFENNQK